MKFEVYNHEKEIHEEIEFDLWAVPHFHYDCASNKETHIVCEPFPGYVMQVPLGDEYAQLVPAKKTIKNMSALEALKYSSERIEAWAW